MKDFKELYEDAMETVFSGKLRGTIYNRELMNEAMTGKLYEVCIIGILIFVISERLNFVHLRPTPSPWQLHTFLSMLMNQTCTSVVLAALI